MQRFDLSKKFSADCVVTDKARAGELYHVARNSVGSGATLTPIARYFVWQPEFVEGFNAHFAACLVGPRPNDRQSSVIASNRILDKFEDQVASLGAPLRLFPCAGLASGVRRFV